MKQQQETSQVRLLAIESKDASHSPYRCYIRCAACERAYYQISDEHIISNAQVSNCAGNPQVSLLVQLVSGELSGEEEFLGKKCDHCGTPFLTETLASFEQRLLQEETLMLLYDENPKMLLYKEKIMIFVGKIDSTHYPQKFFQAHEKESWYSRSNQFSLPLYADTLPKILMKVEESLDFPSDFYSWLSLFE